MKQSNKLYKLMLIIVSAILSFNAIAQSPIAFGSPYVRNWRAYDRFPMVNGNYSNPLKMFKINSEIYAFGRIYSSGYAGQYITDDTTYAFNPATNLWTQKKSSPTSPFNNNLNFVINDVYYFGLGRSIDYNTPYPYTRTYPSTTINAYNATTNIWSTVANYPDSNLFYPLAFTINNKAYVVGGFRDSSGIETVSMKTNIYDPISNTWNSDDDAPVLFQENESKEWNVFVANNKAYIFSTIDYNKSTWEFDPNATTGNKWTQKAAPNTLQNSKYYAVVNSVNGFKIMGGTYEYFFDDGNGTSYWTTADNDSTYEYNIANDSWAVTKASNRFENYQFSTVLYDELFFYSQNQQQNGGLNLGYGNEFYGYAYVDNSFLSMPLDTINVNHTFTGICANTTPTVSYSVSNHLNYDNQFIIVITRNDGYILDTLATINDSISGSVQVTMPSYSSLLVKANYYGLENLKLAVLTTSPRTIFNNEGKSFSFVNDPALLQLSLDFAGQESCPGTPMQITARLFQQNPYSFLKPTTVNWGSVYGGTTPVNDSINILTSDSTATYLQSYPLSATKNFFCYNKDTTYTYNYAYYAGITRQSGTPIASYKMEIAEGNSICNGGNETKHIYTTIDPFYYTTKDSVDIAYTYSKNGVVFKAGNYISYRYARFIDTITLNNVNANDVLQLKIVFQANSCDTTAIDSSSTTLTFNNYNSSLTTDKALQYNFNNNLIDSSSKHNNGIGENIAFTTDRFGHANSALRIFRDSTATNVSQVVSDTTVDITGNAVRTISFWFKTDSLGYHYSQNLSTGYQYAHRPAVLGWGTVNSNTNSTGSFIHIQPETKSVIFRGHYNDVTTNNNVFKFGEWTHVAFVYDSLSFNIYVNGKCEAHSYDFSTAVQSNTGVAYYGGNHYLSTENSHFRIGNDGTGVNFNNDWAAPFDGSVDDIFIYDKAMTACQIDSLFKRVETGNCTPTSSTINAAICQGNTYHFKNINIATTGTYKDTLQNANGCDSIVTLNLTIKQKSSSTINRTFCDGTSYNFNGKLYNAVGTFYDTLRNAVGCDSIVTLHLTRVYPSTSTTIISVCTSQLPIVWNGKTYNAYGNDVMHFTNAAGCDSAAYLDLRKPIVVNGYKYDTVCSNQLPYLFCGITINASGSYASATMQTAQGCDSVSILILTVKQASTKLVKDTIQSNQTYSFNGNTYNTTGTYFGTFVNAVGCDSVVTLQLYVKQAATPITGNLVGCSFTLTNSLSNSTGGGNWRSSNTSVATVNTYGVVTNISNGTTTITYTYYKSGVPYTATVNYIVAVVTSLSAITGASVVCVGSTIQLSNTTSGGVWSSLNDRGVINSNGIYTGGNAGNWGEVKYTVTNSFGCGASTNKIITVNAIPTVPSIVYAPGTASNPQAGAPTGSFCVGRVFGVAGIPIGGSWSATGAASITTNGIVTINSVGAGSIKYVYTNSNGCSNSRTMSGNGYTCAARGAINNEQLAMDNDFTIYPNPAKSFINLNIETLVGKGSIVITDLYGKTIKTQVLSIGTNTINIADMCKGFYLVSVVAANQKTTKKLIVE